MKSRPDYDKFVLAASPCLSAVIQFVRGITQMKMSCLTHEAACSFGIMPFVRRISVL